MPSGYDSQGNLVGAAKQQHEDKMAREQGQGQEEGGDGDNRSQSPKLLGAAKVMHEWKEQREQQQGEEHGQGQRDSSGVISGQGQGSQEHGKDQGSQPQGREQGKRSRSPSPYGRGYDREGNLVGAAKIMHEWKEQREQQEGQEQK